MLRKVLVPLGCSKESEDTFARIERYLDPDDEVILLQIILPAKTITLGEQVFMTDQDLVPDAEVTNHVIPAGRTLKLEGQVLLTEGQIEEHERIKSLAYLRGLVRRAGKGPSRCRYHVMLSESVARGIVEFAESEGVDFIVMHAQDRRGLAKLIKRSLAWDVQQATFIEVKVCSLGKVAGAA